MSKLKAVMAEFETKIRGAVIADLVGASGEDATKPAATAKRKYTRKAKPADASSAADPNAPAPAPKKRGRPKKSAAAPPTTPEIAPVAEQAEG